MSENLHEPRLAVHVEDLTVSYHHTPVLWDIDLDVPPACWPRSSDPTAPARAP